MSMAMKGVTQSTQQALQGQAAQSGQTTVNEDNRRIAEMKDARDAMKGRFPKPLKVRPGQADDNVIINRCKPAVRKVVSSLFGKGVDFELEEGTSEEAQQWLDDCWKFNKKKITLKKWAMNGSICGEGFLKVIPAAPGQKFPRVVPLDPLMVSVQTAPDDVDTPVAFQVCWSGIDQDTGKAMDYREVEMQAPNKMSWLIVTQHKDPKTQDWITDNSVTWAKPWAPIHANQNIEAANQFWGDALIDANVVQVNRDLNFFYSNGARILRLHAHPKDWIKGMRAKEIETAVDETLVLHNKEAEIGSLEMGAAGITAIMQMIAKLEQAIEGLTQVPNITTGANIDTVPKVTSGVALTILHQPLIDLVESMQETYGECLQELNSHLLELGNFGTGIEVSNHWQDLLPGDDLALAQTMQLVDQMGVASKETISLRMGFDWDEEQDKMDNEAQAAAKQNNAGYGMDPLAAQFGKQPLPPGQQQGLNHPAMQQARQAAMSQSKGGQQDGQ